MKKIALFLLGVSFVVVQPPSASASLMVDNLSGINVSYDDTTGYYWYWDLSRFTGMTYPEQITEIAAISVPGYAGTWHMASLAEMTTLWKADSHPKCNGALMEHFGRGFVVEAFSRTII